MQDVTTPVPTGILILRAWLEGESAQLFAYGGDGRLVAASEALPEAELAYTDPGFLLGPPLDEPPYSINDIVY